MKNKKVLQNKKHENVIKQKIDTNIFYFFPIPFIFYFFTTDPVIGLGDTALLIDEMVRCVINTHVNNHNITVLFGYIFSNLPLDNIVFKVLLSTFFVSSLILLIFKLIKSTLIQVLSSLVLVILSSSILMYLFSSLPFDTIAFKCNLVSTFFGSFAIIMFYLLMLKLTKNLWVSIFASLFLMVSNSIWWHSTIVENYAVNALISCAIIYCYASFETENKVKWIYIAGILAGLAIFNHVQMGIWIPATGIFIFINRNKFKEGWFIVAFRCSLWFFVGFTPYFITLLKDIAEIGSAAKVLDNASGSNFKSIMLNLDLFNDIRDILRLTFIQFPNIFLILIIAGSYVTWVKMKFTKTSIGIIIAAGINTFFFMSFHTWDKFAFMIPTWVVLGFYGGLGINWIWEEVKVRQKKMLIPLIIIMICSIIFPIYFYGQLATWGEKPGSYWSKYYNNDYTFNSHNCAKYIANPNKSNYYDVEYFSKLLFEKLPKGAIFIDDDSRTYYPLKYYYQRYYNVRPDINVILMNTWGWSAAQWGEGMDVDGFIKLISSSIAYKPIFIISTQSPFTPRNKQEEEEEKKKNPERKWLIPALAELNISYEAFYLDESHCVYQLKSTSNMLPKVEMKLDFIGMHVGSNFQNEGKEIIKNNFSNDEPIMVQIKFKKNFDPVLIMFRWYDSEGNLFFESVPFNIPPNNTAVWSYLEGQAVKKKGQWRVELYVTDKKIATHNFVIE